MDQRRRVYFLIINFSLAFAALYFFTPGKNNFSDPAYSSMFLIAAAIIIAQYPFLDAARNWWLKILVFYLSMVLFFGLFGLFNSWNSMVGSSEAGSWMARADAATRMIVLGHMFGGWLLPVVIFVNWLFRKSFFRNQTGPSA